MSNAAAAGVLGLIAFGVVAGVASYQISTHIEKARDAQAFAGTYPSPQSINEPASALVDVPAVESEPVEFGERVAPVEFYRVLKHYHESGRLTLDYISVLSRELSALSTRKGSAGDGAATTTSGNVDG